ncbi:polyphenol oxidase family protein [Actinotignum sp. GS-2025a]|uniref:polyphenol oxidase family protein n=1 Tax=Actinotignum TaxID=1653174 RepID=UPI00254BBA02|nr:polyphenol oxidase family protein [Actinotignum timonense]MDK6926966.1 polyphenol oxidase family protein [Actinotignum timonense]
MTRSALVEWVADISVPGGRIRAGFTSRAGGVSRAPFAGLNVAHHVGDDPATVERNRALLAAQIGQRPVYMDQVHGDHLEDAGVLTSAGTFVAPDTDGLLIDIPLSSGAAPVPRGAAAVVMVADCLPLLLVAQDRRAGAAVHVGRRGLEAGIGPAAARALGPEHLIAYLGPSICGRCYEVPEELRASVAARIPEAAGRTAWGTPSLDIAAGLTAQLRAVGVSEIHVSPRCTREDPDFYSYRRASRTGRFAGVLAVDCNAPAARRADKAGRVA